MHSNHPYIYIHTCIWADFNKTIERVLLDFLSAATLAESPVTLPESLSDVTFRFGVRGWGPGCFDFLYRAPHPLNKATAAWLMVVNALLTFISYKSLSNGIYIYRWYININIYIYVRYWIIYRSCWVSCLSSRTPKMELRFANERRVTQLQATALGLLLLSWLREFTAMMMMMMMMRITWWWWELHDTWYTTLALFGVQNRGVITYYIYVCIYIYILPIYYLVYIYMYKYIYIFI